MKTCPGPRARRMYIAKQAVHQRLLFVICKQAVHQRSLCVCLNLLSTKHGQFRSGDIYVYKCFVLCFSIAILASVRSCDRGLITYIGIALSKLCSSGCF